MRKFAVNTVQLDRLEIQEDEKTLTVPAVITREDVFPYEDIGDVYLPKEELENVAFTASNAWIVEDHPDEIVLVNADDIRGTLRNGRVDGNRAKADLIFFKDRCAPKYLDGIKSGEIQSVSIGFFFDAIKKSGSFDGKHYDFVKQGMFIDHLAVGRFRGRCAFPYCGIGLDQSELHSIGLDPYPNEHSCRLRDPSTLDIVGSGTRKHNGKTYRVIFGKPKGKPKASSVEQAYRYPTKTWTESEARAHCKSHNGTFHPAEKGGNGVKEENHEEREREKLHRQAEARGKKYGIKFREGEGHLTPPKGYPSDESDYADPVNYKYPLVTEKRCRNALNRWGQFRRGYSQKERNTIYERIIKGVLKYHIDVTYNEELPEERALPESVKKLLKGWKSADTLIKKVQMLVNQLQS